MATIDLTVRGAGIFGLTVAFEALQRGATVRVIDPAGPGGGASGGVVGALAPHAPENWNPKKAFQLECLLLARRYWPEVEAVSGLSTGYRTSGRLQPIEDERALARAIERGQSAADLWQGQAEWRVTQDPGPWAPRAAHGHWIHDTLSAQLDPLLAVTSLAAGVVALGGEVVADGPESGSVVHATGWQGLVALSEATGTMVGRGEKGQAAVFAADPGPVPQIFADGLHIISHGDGRVAVGSTSEREFDDLDSTDALLNEVVAKARTYVPALADAPVLARWAGVRPRARSRGPVVGPYPNRPGHFVANGGFKIGFAVAPGLAPMVVDLALEQKDRVPENFRLQSLVS